MSQIITFPSASKTSKLSASPTSKIPQSTDWIFQDFFNAMLDGDLSNNLLSSIQISDLFPQENMTRSAFQKHHSLLGNLCETYNESDKLSLPDLGSEKSSDDEDDDDTSFDFYYEQNTYQLSEEDFSMEMLASPPVLIESGISSIHDYDMVSLNAVMPQVTYQTLTKRKSTASFNSLKSGIMNVLHLNKKPKVEHDALSLQKNDTKLSKSSVSMKLKKFLKFRF